MSDDQQASEEVQLSEKEENGQEVQQQGVEEVDTSQTNDKGPEKFVDQEKEDLRQELGELKDQYLRKQADFDNFRKRLLRDKEESVAFANKKILEDLVPVLDDFERAIKSSEESKEFQSLHDGIQLIEKQMASMLEKKWGLIRFDSLDQEFDPQKHEAVTVEPREGDIQVVLEEYQKGYILNDRVLRTAKVKVSMPTTKGE